MQTVAVVNYFEVIFSQALWSRVQLEVVRMRLYLHQVWRIFGFQLRDWVQVILLNFNLARLDKSHRWLVCIRRLICKSLSLIDRSLSTEFSVFYIVCKCVEFLLCLQLVLSVVLKLNSK